MTPIQNVARQCKEESKTTQTSKTSAVKPRILASCATGLNVEGLKQKKVSRLEDRLLWAASPQREWLQLIDGARLLFDAKLTEQRVYLIAGAASGYSRYERAKAIPV